MLELCVEFTINYVWFNCRMKELELEDRQYEVDKELAELCQVPRKILL